MNGNGTEEPTNDLTNDLSDRQLLLLVLERVTKIEERVTRLEVAEEDRKRETRPLWERLNTQIAQLNEQMTQVLARLSAIEEEQRRMRHDITMFREDLRNERLERLYLAERVTALDRGQA